MTRRPRAVAKDAIDLARGLMNGVVPRFRAQARLRQLEEELDG